jgi:gp32 DNA binding protein like
MTFDLKSLKSGSKSTEKLINAINSTQKKFKKDERYWELAVDKAGNGFATIRFLDAPFVDGEDGVPFSAPLFTHGFKGPNGQWYIENSLTTLGEQDPVSEYNSKLWATGIESNKNIARAQKRQLNYVSNILVIKDQANPENESKVFLYRYGKEIFDKVQERLPELKKEDTVADPDFLYFNPFSFWDGANFKLKARKKDSGFRTYDKSEFVAPSQVAKTEGEIDKLWKASYSLREVTDPKNFKSYEVLKKRLDLVLDLAGTNGSAPLKTAEDTVAAEVADATAGGLDQEDMDVFSRLADE